MNRLEKIVKQVQEKLVEERNLEEKLDDLSVAAAEIEQEQAPELARITLLHSDMILARAEKSRRFWMRLSMVLGGILVVGLAVFILCC